MNALELIQQRVEAPFGEQTKPKHGLQEPTAVDLIQSASGGLPEFDKSTLIGGIFTPAGLEEWASTHQQESNEFIVRGASRKAWKAAGLPQAGRGKRKEVAEAVKGFYAERAKELPPITGPEIRAKTLGDILTAIPRRIAEGYENLTKSEELETASAHSLDTIVQTGTFIPNAASGIVQTGKGIGLKADTLLGVDRRKKLEEAGFDGEHLKALPPSELDRLSYDEEYRNVMLELWNYHKSQKPSRRQLPPIAKRLAGNDPNAPLDTADFLTKWEREAWSIEEQSAGQILTSLYPQNKFADGLGEFLDNTKDLSDDVRAHSVEKWMKNGGIEGRVTAGILHGVEDTVRTLMAFKAVGAPYGKADLPMEIFLNASLRSALSSAMKEGVNPEEKLSSFLIGLAYQNTPILSKLMPTAASTVVADIALNAGITTVKRDRTWEAAMARAKAEGIPQHALGFWLMEAAQEYGADVVFGLQTRPYGSTPSSLPPRIETDLRYMGQRYIELSNMSRTGIEGRRLKNRDANPNIPVLEAKMLSLMKEAGEAKERGDDHTVSRALEDYQHAREAYEAIFRGKPAIHTRPPSEKPVLDGDYSGVRPDQEDRERSEARIAEERIKSEGQLANERGAVPVSGAAQRQIAALDDSTRLPGELKKTSLLPAKQAVTPAARVEAPKPAEPEKIKGRKVEAPVKPVEAVKAVEETKPSEADLNIREKKVDVEPAKPAKPKAMKDQLEYLESASGVKFRAEPQLPVNKIKLSPDVMQFKEGGDPRTGETEPLRGKYDPLGAGAIVVWERLNGDFEVVTGRHRLALARRSGLKGISAHVAREADGFTRAQAITLDAEMNIRDGQGKVSDYALYFKNTDITEAEADARGLLSRDKGRAGYAIGKEASPDLYAAFRAGSIGEKKAAAIASAAPGMPEVQHLGMLYANKNSASDTANYMQSAMANRPKGAGSKNQQGLLAGWDESWERNAQLEAKAASAIQKEMSTELNALDAARRLTGEAYKKAVAKYGFKPGEIDKEAIIERILELRQEIENFKGWAKFPEFAKMVRERAGTFVEDKIKPEEPAPAKDDSMDMFAEAPTKLPPPVKKVTGKKVDVEPPKPEEPSKPDGITRDQVAPEREYAILEKSSKLLETVPADLKEGVREAFRGIAEAFRPDLSKMGVGPVLFDGDKYKTVLPHFKASWDAFSRAGKSIVEWAKALLHDMGPKARPYIERFIEDTFPDNREIGKEFLRVTSPKKDSAIYEGYVKEIPNGRAWESLLPDAVRNQSLIEKMIPDLMASPRPLKDSEVATLLVAKVDRFNLREEAGAALKADPDNPEKQAKYRAADDALVSVWQAFDRCGTETARGLAAYKMVMDEQFSFVEIEKSIRSQKGGRPLSAEERADAESIARDYKYLTQLRDRHIGEMEARVSDQEKMIDLLTAREQFELLKMEGKPKLKKMSVAERLAEAGKMMANESADALGDSDMRLHNLPIIPYAQRVYHLARWGAGNILRGTANWTDIAIKHFDAKGEDVRPYIEDAKRRASEIAKNTRSLIESDGADSTAPREGGGKKTTPMPKFGEDEPTGADMRKLYKHIVETKGIDKLFDVTREAQAVLKRAGHDLELDRIMAIFSDWGQVRPVSGDVVNKIVSQLRGEAQIELNIRHVKATWESPKRTGQQRYGPSQEAREKKRILHELVKEAEAAGILKRTDSEAQQKSAMDAIETRLANQIADKRKAIERHVAITQTKKVREYSQRAIELRAELDELNKIYSATFPKETKPVDRLQNAKDAVGRRKDKIRSQIAEKQRDTPKKGRKVQPDQELDRLLAEEKMLNDLMDKYLPEDRDAYADDKAAASREARLVREIQKLQKEIDSGVKTEKISGKNITNERIEQLTRERDARQEIHKILFPPKEITQEQRLDMAIKGAERSLKIAEEDLKAAKIGIFHKREKTDLSHSRRLAELRSSVATTRDMIRELYDLKNPGKREHDAKVKRINSVIKELERRLAFGDFTPRTHGKHIDISGDRLAMQAQARLAMLRSEFNQKKEDARWSMLPASKKASEGFVEAYSTTWNFFRNIKSSFDFSGIARQGLPTLYSNPIIWAKSIPDIFKAYKSAENGMKYWEEFRQRPNFELYVRSGLGISHGDGKGGFGPTDDIVRPDIAAKVPLQMRHQRAFAVTLNGLRANLFDTWLKNSPDPFDRSDDHIKSIAREVNIWTGRGPIDHQYVKGLGLVFWAPRFISSAFHMATRPITLPFEYVLFGAGSGKGISRGIFGDDKYSQWARKRVATQYIRAIGSLAALYATSYGMAVLMGEEERWLDELEVDPTSSRFSKLRVPGTDYVIDPLTFVRPMITLISRLFRGSMKGSSRTFQIYPSPLNHPDSVESGFAGTKRGLRQTVSDFEQTKWHPAAGSLIQAITSRDFMGEEMEPWWAIATAIGPLVPASMIQMFRTEVGPSLDEMDITQLPSWAILSALAIVGVQPSPSNFNTPRQQRVRLTAERFDAEIYKAARRLAISKINKPDDVEKFRNYVREVGWEAARDAYTKRRKSLGKNPGAKREREDVNSLRIIADRVKK